MNNLKFRIWDKKGKKFITKDFSLIFSSNSVKIAFIIKEKKDIENLLNESFLDKEYNENDYEIEQYVRKDKNKNDIFKNDVVKYNTENGILIGRIDWDDQFACWEIIFDNDEDGDMLDFSENIEKIGNIHEKTLEEFIIEES